MTRSKVNEVNGDENDSNNALPFSERVWKKFKELKKDKVNKEAVRKVKI